MALQAMALSALHTSAAPQRLRMLVYGDSLVDGWTSFSSGPRTRFASFLQKALAETHGVDAEVDAIGQAGRAASAALPDLRAQLASTKYDVVMVMLGCNDLFGPFSRGRVPDTRVADKTIDHLRSLHSAARTAGARPIALGLLHHPAFERVEGGRAFIDGFNHRIEGELDAAYIDSARLLPPTGSDPGLWSSDQVHMQDAGYAELGRKLAQPLVSTLGLTRAATSGEHAHGSRHDREHHRGAAASHGEGTNPVEE